MYHEICGYFVVLNKMTCKIATHEASNLNARVKLNDPYIMDSTEFLDIDLDIEYGEGYLPKDLGSN